jgi:isopentenyl-diphosphate Delta-isomerase
LTLSLVQIVDESGRTVGEMEKLAAHENGGTWHRAISVFLFDQQGQLLIQQRASGKYHFAGLWANSCCSHPATSETIEQAAQRPAKWYAQRAMLHELGVYSIVKELAVVRYEAHDPVTGHTEREHDHILVGILNEEPTPNPSEVQATRWITLQDLTTEIEQQPENFAPWLPVILSRGLLTNQRRVPGQRHP